jgi:hypothetical protein
MLDHADILALALEHEKIIGVARVVTDFNYACYLSAPDTVGYYPKIGFS